MAMCSATNRIYLKNVYKHSVLRYETKEPATVVARLFEWMVLREIKVSMLSLSVPLPAEDVRQPMISLIINSATKLLAAQIKSNNLLIYSFVNALTCTCPCLRLLAFVECNIDQSVSALLMLSKKLLSLRFVSCSGLKVEYFQGFTCPDVKELAVLSETSEEVQAALIAMCPNVRIVHERRQVVAEEISSSYDSI